MQKYLDIKDKVVELKDLHTIDEMTVLLGVSKPTIFRCMKQFGLSKLPLFKGNKRKKYTLDEKFFETVTEHSSYVAGLLYADGCIVQPEKGGSYFTLTLIDKELLEQVSVALKSNYPIKEHKDKRKDYNRKPIYKLQINGKKLCSDLNHFWNLFPRKTNTISFPTFKDPNMTCHFVRGFFDGDGCISKVHSQGARGGWMIHFTCASIKFASALAEWLSLNNIKNRIEKYQKKECWAVYVNTGYGNLEKFYALIYKGASIALRRKHLKFKQAMEIPPKLTYKNPEPPAERWSDIH